MRASANVCATSLEIEFIFDHSQPAKEGDSKGEPALRCQVNSHERCAATACAQGHAMAISYFPGWSFHIRHGLFRNRLPSPLLPLEICEQYQGLNPMSKKDRRADPEVGGLTLLRDDIRERRARKEEPK